MNRTMWYLAGGLAVGEVGGHSTSGADSGTGCKWTAGGFIGAGIEHMIDQHWSWKLEYDYVRFASKNGAQTLTVVTRGGTLPLGSTISVGGSADDNIVTVGLNYHFGTH